MNYTFLTLLIAMGILLLQPELAPATIRIKLLLLSSICLASHLIGEYMSVQ
jgi:hypothetical protein